jgi:nicotinate-nucleotide pyrophosphorylase (carboxylating)
METERLLYEMLRDDAGKGDITTRLVIERDVRVRAVVVARGSGVVAGLREARAIFRRAGAKARALVREGERVRVGCKIMEVTGSARAVFAAERVALNLMMRMSGIATETARLVRLARSGNPRVVVAATRKTAPLLTRFDKRAVVIGGGSPHRRDLSERILIKRNHVKVVGSVEEAVRRAKRGGCVEVEVSTPSEALRAARAGAEIVMLDNVRVSAVRRTIELLKREGLRESVLIEVSGGITPANIKAYAAAGPDVISTSYMTMRASPLDMALEVVQAWRRTKSR